MADPPIRVRDEGSGVRLITLDRPPANAIDLSLLEALERRLEEAAGDPSVRAVVLTGAGRFFCAGFDLRAERRSVEEVEAMVTAYRRSHRSLLGLPKPTVAAVNGHAIAGGLVLALGCDHRLGADGELRFGLNEVSIGAAFPKAAIEIVRLRLSDESASELVLGARLLPIGEAVRHGVVRRVVAVGELLPSAIALAAELGSFPREVYAHAKAALVAEALARIDAEPIAEELRTAALWTTEESRQARRRQLEDLTG